MPDHPDLSADDIKSIVEYIREESANAGAEKAPFAKPTKRHPAYIPLSTSDFQVFISFLAIVAMLIAALLFAVQLKEYERKREAEL